MAVSDENGGAIIIWEDSRSGNKDPYAQRINASGVVQWQTDGFVFGSGAGDANDLDITPDGTGGAIVTWSDDRNGNDDVFAQHIDRGGRTARFVPVLNGVFDVPGDQGGYVNLVWDSDFYDYAFGEITEYTVWRALTQVSAQSKLSAGAELVSSPEVALEAASSNSETVIIRHAVYNGDRYYWELMSTHTAYRLLGYASVVPTLFDSTAVCDDYHYFQVIAHTSNPDVYYVSNPDSGYSLDNLPPGVLLGFAVAYNTGIGNQLMWGECPEEDFQYFRVYRSTNPNFVPSPAEIVHSTIGTGWMDPNYDGWNVYYKITALDISGNESDPASPGTATAVTEQTIPKTFVLHQNVPNPFNPMTTIAFELPGRANVRLAIYDVSGRLVRALIDADMAPGHKSVQWNGLDAGGREVASGVYFYRLESAAFNQSRKMVLLR
jgi:hypothetical protein